MSKVGALKRTVLDAMLEGGESVFMQLDTHRRGLELPSHLRGPEAPREVLLELGINLATPMRDFKGTDDRLEVTLIFNFVPFPCVIPWAAVLAIGVRGGAKAFVWLEPETARVPKSEAAADAEQTRRTLPPGWDVIAGSKKS